MKALCLLLVLAVFACQQRNKSTLENNPDAVRDLLIDRSFWQKKAVNSPDSRMSVHRFTITNTSQRYVYRQIKIRFDYYDRAYHKIDSAIRIIDRVVEPRSAVKIDTVQTKLTKEGVASATATVVNASAD